jgi:hypothetical protein
MNAIRRVAIQVLENLLDGVGFFSTAQPAPRTKDKGLRGALRAGQAALGHRLNQRLAQGLVAKGGIGCCHAQYFLSQGV